LYVLFLLPVKDWDKWLEIHVVCAEKMHLTTLFSYLTIQVYDVTPFMDEHPGGDEVLLAVTGEPYFGDFIVSA
jgi:hypothetical protein